MNNLSAFYIKIANSVVEENNGHTKKQDGAVRKILETLAPSFAGLVLPSSVLGLGYGLTRAGTLGKNQRKRLREQNNLDPEANLILRNMGRGYLAGGLGQAISHVALNEIFRPDFLKQPGLIRTLLPKIIGSNLAFLATDKYSRGALE
jgi:hypothetical protein